VSLPAFLRKRFVLSQASNPLQRPHPGAALRRPGRRTVLWSKSSSREVSRPYSVLESANRDGASTARSVPPERPPSSVFLRPSRVSSSLTPAALFHAAAAHGVLPFRAFPSAPTLPGSSPGDPLSTFPCSPEGVQPRPQGLLSARSPCSPREYCILRRTDALMGFLLSRLSLASGNPVSRRHIRS